MSKEVDDLAINWQFNIVRNKSLSLDKEYYDNVLINIYSIPNKVNLGNDRYININKNICVNNISFNDLVNLRNLCSKVIKDIKSQRGDKNV